MSSSLPTPPDVPACQCILPGWCPRHQLHKNANWYTLCQTRPEFRLAWDEGRGPGQNLPAFSGKKATPPTPGPGTELKKILGNCCPSKYAKPMNDLGVEGCRAQLDTLITLVCSETRTHHRTHLAPAVARTFIQLAISRAALAAQNFQPTKKATPDGT